MGEYMQTSKETERKEITGMISDIQRFSLHDGPGIRTTVFLKGCPLRCFWCHNPETLSRNKELQYFSKKCTNCGACIKVCPVNAHVHEENSHIFLRDRCTACGLCVDVCCFGALDQVGKEMTVINLFDELKKDKAYFNYSGGGITFSGGEPLMQNQFILGVLKLCHIEGIHTAIETSGYSHWENLEALIPWLDLIIMDIKHMNEVQHKKFTGVSNKKILENAAQLSQSGVKLLIRTPIIPGVNASIEDIGAIAEFISTFPNLLYYELMPFHQMAQDKYQSVGIENRAMNIHPPSPELLSALAEHGAHKGVRDVRIATP